MPKRRAAVNLDIQTSLLHHQVDLLRLEAGERKKAFRILDNMMNDVLGRLTDKDITKFSKSRLTSLLSQTTQTIERYYGKVRDLADETLLGVAEVQAAHVASELESTFAGIDLSASLPSEAVLSRVAGDSLIMGAPSEEWWARQARDVAFRFASTVRQGIAAGDTTEQVASRVAGRSGYPGIMDVTRANARSLVHTSIMEVANEARMASYQANDDVVDGVHQVSTLDSNTTDTCMAYDGAEFDLDGEPINGTDLPYEGGCPRHWGCRSIEVPITKTFKELGINAPEPKGDTRASEDGQVPADWTFSDFLDTMSEDQQNEMLGEGRAELWRNGDITLPQLMDQKGNPLTLAELKDKYG